MTAVALSVEEFVASLPMPRFVKVRGEWRVVGRGLKRGHEYDVMKRDGSTTRVRIERVTRRRSNGEVLAMFEALRSPGDGLFRRWAEEDAMSELDDWGDPVWGDWNEFAGDW